MSINKSNRLPKSHKGMINRGRVGWDVDLPVITGRNDFYYQVLNRELRLALAAATLALFESFFVLTLSRLV
jgi:hypothetical protein